MGRDRGTYYTHHPEFMHFGCENLQEVWNDIRRRQYAREDIAFIREYCAQMTDRLGAKWRQDSFAKYHPNRRLEELSPQQLVEWLGHVTLEIRLFEELVGDAKGLLQKLGWTPDKEWLELVDRYGRETTVEGLTAEEIGDWIGYLCDELDKKPPPPPELPPLHVSANVRYVGTDQAKDRAFTSAVAKGAKHLPRVSRINDDGTIEVKSKAWGNSVMLVNADEIEPR